jgi:hypothetical protein
VAILSTTSPGVATAVSPGTTTISAVFEAAKATAPLTVNAPVLVDAGIDASADAAIDSGIDASADAGADASEDASAEAGDAGVCTLLDLSNTPVVTSTTVIGSPPTLTGGLSTIVPGNYTLTSITDYLAPDAGFGLSGVPIQEIAIIGPTTAIFDAIQFDADDGGPTTETESGNDYTVSGNTVTYTTPICGGSTQAAEGFMATTTGLVLSYTSPPPVAFTEIITFALNTP